MKTCFCQVIQVSWELTRDLCQCSLNTKGQGCCVPKKGCDCDNESITVGVRDFFFSSLQNTFLSASCVLCQSSVKSWHLSKSTPAAPLFPGFLKFLTRLEGTSVPHLSPELLTTASVQVSLASFQSHTVHGMFFLKPIELCHFPD